MCLPTDAQVIKREFASVTDYLYAKVFGLPTEEGAGGAGSYWRNYQHQKRGRGTILFCCLGNPAFNGLHFFTNLHTTLPIMLVERRPRRPADGRQVAVVPPDFNDCLRVVWRPNVSAASDTPTSLACAGRYGR